MLCTNCRTYQNRARASARSFGLPKQDAVRRCLDSRLRELLCEKAELQQVPHMGSCVHKTVESAVDTLTVLVTDSKARQGSNQIERIGISITIRFSVEQNANGRINLPYYNNLFFMLSTKIWRKPGLAFVRYFM